MGQSTLLSLEANLSKALLVVAILLSPIEVGP